MNRIVDAIIQRLADDQGLDISPYDESFLLKAIQKRLAALGLSALEEYPRYLTEHGAEALAFYRSLHIGYSDFFRDPLTFALLEKLILPRLIADKEQSGQNEIRVWSAGCASGQEAWSLAMLLDELTGASTPTVSYRIFGTDLSESDLALAAAGIYTADAVGSITTRRLRDFFSPHGAAFAIHPRLRTHVVFSTYDLLHAQSRSPDASIYGDFDLVICCNLLYYYRPSNRTLILNKVFGALSPTGYFVTGEAERDIIIQDQRLGAVMPAATIFQKRNLP